MKKRTLIIGFTLVFSTVLLSACGQKGPLYLPAKPAQAGHATAETAVTADHKTDAE